MVVIRCLGGVRPRRVQGRHQHVAWARGLEDLERPGDPVAADPRPADVEHGGLGHRAQGLVRGLYDQVSPLAQGGGGKAAVEGEVRPVGLVHQKGDPAAVAAGRELANAGAHPVVVRGDREDGGRSPRAARESLAQVRCGRRGETEVVVILGLGPHRHRVRQNHGGEGALMAVPRDDDRIAWFPHRGHDRRVYPDRRSVHQEPAPVRAEGLAREFLGLRDDPTRVGEVIQSL
mmetsp:Transcript_2643/g.9051  ORF Transcript_2643/g.9051 Transcript_2643/m.9051 type:complete len:232 (+) Transcript_2643:682-1377(+)